MFHLSSIALRLPRVAGNARWIFALAGGLGALLVAAPALESSASRVLPSAARLVSLSSFVHVDPEAGTATTGFVIGGSEQKLLLLRGIGPGLQQFGMNDGLPDPVLRVLNSAGREIARNFGWALERNADELRLAAAEVGAFPLATGSADAALLLRLTPGAYTLAVESGTSRAGNVLTEVYAIGCGDSLANLAMIANITAVRPGFLGTFRVTGEAPRKFLVRAVGPALGVMGVRNALADPKLTIYRDAGAATIARNDDWCDGGPSDNGSDEIAAVMTACGAFALPADGKDAALLVTLAPGSYTAQVSGKGADTGLVLLEIYAVP